MGRGQGGQERQVEEGQTEREVDGEEGWLDEGDGYMGEADRGSLGTWRKGEKTQVDREKPTERERGGGKVKAIGIFCFSQLDWNEAEKKFA